MISRTLMLMPSYELTLANLAGQFEKALTSPPFFPIANQFTDQEGNACSIGKKPADSLTGQ